MSISPMVCLYNLVPLFIFYYPEHSPTLHAVANSIDMTAGVLLPIALGAIFDAYQYQVKLAWWWVFYCIAAIYMLGKSITIVPKYQFFTILLSIASFIILGTFAFVCFGSAETQNWDENDDQSKKHSQNFTLDKEVPSIVTTTKK